MGMMKGLANKIQRKDSTEPAPQRQETTQSGLSGSLSRAQKEGVTGCSHFHREVRCLGNPSIVFNRVLIETPIMPKVRLALND